MALVSSGFWAEVTLVDYGGNETRKSYQMVAADYDTAIIDFAIVAPALINVTDAVISAYSIQERYVQDALSLPATVNPVSVKAVLTAYIDDAGNKKASFDIPAPKIGIFQNTIGAGADIVDTTDAAVLAYKGLFDTGEQLLISDGESLGGLIGGIRTTQARRLA